jgi:uncharacterized protein (TIGR00369 family)
LSQFLWQELIFTMEQSEHFKALKSMYAAAPVNDAFAPELEISEGESRVSITVSATHFHSAGALHGSVYFKMLDDAAFFAANSLEDEFFVLTTSFTTYITRPVSQGTITAVGRVVNANRSQWIAEAVLYNQENREIARGNGVFVRSKVLLADTPGYRDVT